MNTKRWRSDLKPTGLVTNEVRLNLCKIPGIERLSHGEPTWFIGGRKTFVTYADHHHDDRLGFWCAAPLGAQELLAGSAPEKFFRPPYAGIRGWLGVYLDVPVDWDRVADIVEDAYRAVAGRRSLALLDALGRRAKRLA